MIAPHESSPASAAEAPPSFGQAPATPVDFNYLVDEVRRLIVKVANLPNVQPESIDPEQPLYRDGLGLDSIDVLELVVNVERTYGLKIRNDDLGRMALRNVASLAAALSRHLTDPSTQAAPSQGA